MLQNAVACIFQSALAWGEGSSKVYVNHRILLLFPFLVHVCHNLFKVGNGIWKFLPKLLQITKAHNGFLSGGFFLFIIIGLCDGQISAFWLWGFL